MAQAITLFAWPLVASYAVYKVIMMVVWPPKFSPFAAGLGGAMTLWGQALYTMRHATPELDEWGVALTMLGVALMLLPKLWGMLKRSAKNAQLPPHTFDEKP